MTSFETGLRDYATQLLDILGPDLAVKFARDRHLIGIAQIIQQLIGQDDTTN